MKKAIYAVVLLATVFLGYGMYKANTPEGKQRSRERQAIELCWDAQGKKSNNASTGSFIAGTCESMEATFTKKWGVNP